MVAIWGKAGQSPLFAKPTGAKKARNIFVIQSDFNWTSYLSVICKKGQIEIKSKYKNVFRLLGICLDTQIFKIGPPVQNLLVHIHFFVPLFFFTFSLHNSAQIGIK